MKVASLLLACAAAVSAQRSPTRDSFPPPARAMQGEILDVTTALGSSRQARWTPIARSSEVTISSLEAVSRQSAPQTVTYTCDPSINTVPGVCTTLNTTISALYSKVFTNAGANIYITFGDTDLGLSHFLGGLISYSDFRNALQSQATDAADTTAFNSSVPANNPINTNYSVFVTNAAARALGFAPTTGIQPDGTRCSLGNSGCYDAVITISSGVQAAGNFYFRTGAIAFNQYDFYTVVEHETDEILGTGSCAFDACGGKAFAPADLFRYQSNGSRSFGAGNNSSCSFSNSGNACFSIDGIQMLQQYNNINNGQDAGDWLTNCINPLVQDAAACPGVGNVDISAAAEIKLLDVVGFTLVSNAPVSVTTKVTSDTTGIVNGTCSTPPLVTSFTAQSAKVWLYFLVTGANIGDSALIDFVRPDGVINASFQSSVSVLGANGAVCFSPGMSISGTSAASFPGTWTIRVYWNDSAAPLFTINFTLSDASCTYSLSSNGQAFTASGGSATLGITAPQGCAWTISGSPGWAYFTANSGSGSGNVSYQVAANSSVDRSATITVAGLPFTIEQEAAFLSGLSLIGSIPHIAAEELWTTTFTFVNKGAASVQARFSMFGETGSALQLPLVFPQQPSLGTLVGSSIDRTLAPNASLVITTAGPTNVPVQVGSAQLGATGTLDGFAIFHSIPGAQEAVVPLETRNARSYLLPYDNTNGAVLAMAIANVSAQAATIPVIIRDDTGAQIGTDSISLAGNGHTSFVAPDRYPGTANGRGTLEFDPPLGGQISVLGIRFTPFGNTNTLTTIPVLANVGTTGGTMAHLAVANGWKTTFVLVNAGSAAAQAHLDFFDNNGNPLPLPLAFPQFGGGSSAVGSSLDRTLAAGASLVIESTGALSDPLLTGSARLTTNGNVSGFVIFRYEPNGQEAVVPLESRNASAYLLAFDNTNGTATGVAVSNASSQAVNIPVIVRDDSGALIAADTIFLPANGHASFTLPMDRFSGTAGLRGTIEFDTPYGAQISALGIRVPLAHTFTTLPALAK
jgi:hypothetical protein